MKKTTLALLLFNLSVHSNTLKTQEKMLCFPLDNGGQEKVNLIIDWQNQRVSLLLKNRVAEKCQNIGYKNFIDRFLVFRCLDTFLMGTIEENSIHLTLGKARYDLGLSETTYICE